MERAKDRLLYLDYLRGFMVLLVVLDHSMHAYSQHYADFWFMSDIDRSTLIDVFHMHNDAIMMPFLLGLAGLFVFVSLERRGYLSFFKERLLRLGIPFVFGVTVISGILSYKKHEIREGLLKGFFDFWINDYLHWENTPFENFIMGGFWFLYYLALLTVIALVINAVFPWFFRLLGKGVTFMFNRPVAGFIILALMCCVILGVSDIAWGAHWWFGFKPVFYVRRARFIIEGFCFFLGVSAFFAGFLKDPNMLKKLTDSWALWVVLVLVTGAAYTGFTLGYFHDGAYNRDTALFLFQGGSWKDLWPVVQDTSALPLLRTTLLGFYIAAMIPAYLAVFGKFLNTPKPMWISLAACSYGIYILHEPIALSVHVFFYQSSIPALLKFLMAGGLSLGLSWLVVAQVLLKIPGVRRVL